MDKFEIRRLNLKYLIDVQSKGNAADFSRKIGKDSSYINRCLYEEGKKGKKKIGDEIIDSVLSTFSYPPGWLDIPHWNDDYIDSTATRIELTGHINTEPGPDITGRVPLISWVQAGNWAEIIDNHYPGDAEEWRLTTAKVSKYAFALRIVGDSMINPNGYPSLPPGAIVIVEPHRQPQNGDIVIARLEDSMEATIKKLVIDGHQKFLKPLNPQYPIIQINGNCSICGVAIKVEMDL